MRYQAEKQSQKAADTNASSTNGKIVILYCLIETLHDCCFLFRGFLANVINDTTVFRTVVTSGSSAGISSTHGLP